MKEKELIPHSSVLHIALETTLDIRKCHFKLVPFIQYILDIINTKSRYQAILSRQCMKLSNVYHCTEVKAFCIYLFTYLMFTFSYFYNFFSTHCSFSPRLTF